MKNKLTNFDWIASNLIVRNLLQNYLNLTKKKAIQKQLLTVQMFFEIGVVKISQYPEETPVLDSVFN